MNLCEFLPFHSRLDFWEWSFRSDLVSPSGHEENWNIHQMGRSNSMGMIRWDIRGVQFCRRVNEADPNLDDLTMTKWGFHMISWDSVGIYIYMNIWIYDIEV